MTCHQSEFCVYDWSMVNLWFGKVCVVYCVTMVKLGFVMGM